MFSVANQLKMYCVRICAQNKNKTAKYIRVYIYVLLELFGER